MSPSEKIPVDGVGKGAEHGILFKNSSALERAHKLTAVVLDKTGTITKGEPAVTDLMLAEQIRMADAQPVAAGGAPVVNVAGNGQQAAEPATEVLRLAASAERGSEHPLGEAIMRAPQEQGLALSESTDFEGIAGHGIRAVVEGHDVLLGNLRLMQREDVALNGLEAKADVLQKEAKTAMWLALDGQAAALIPIAAGVLAPFDWAPNFLRQLHPILAAAAMAFSSISVVTNSLRLRGVKLDRY